MCKHWASSGCCEERKSEASINGSVPGRKKGAVGKESGEGIITGNGNEREMQAAYHSGMHEGIDAPLCTGMSQHMDPCTSLLYFPNQRLSGEI